MAAQQEMHYDIPTRDIIVYNRFLNTHLWVNSCPITTTFSEFKTMMMKVLKVPLYYDKYTEVVTQEGVLKPEHMVFFLLFMPTDKLEFTLSIDWDRLYSELGGHVSKLSGFPVGN